MKFAKRRFTLLAINLQEFVCLIELIIFRVCVNGVRLRWMLIRSKLQATNGQLCFRGVCSVRI